MEDDNLDLEDSTLDGIKGDDIDDELEELEDILTELDAYEKKKLDEGKREQAVLPGGAKKNSALQQALQQVKDGCPHPRCMHINSSPLMLGRCLFRDVLRLRAPMAMVDTHTHTHTHYFP
jgi:hypothetical protein